MRKCTVDMRCFMTSLAIGLAKDDNGPRAGFGLPKRLYGHPVLHDDIQSPEPQYVRTLH